ncbi:L-threonylcarbamoyladenylate synthase [Actimicrobium sp. GrIS 1.19]|nr:L-threonylcarbamoyladenylate synthase [Actimicrobium sp. GrIS 1.19]
MSVSDSEIAAAARLLEQGQLVAFPTETVYGLGADAENPAAIARIFAAKGRPSNHPVIVHLAPDADLSHWVAAIPAQAQLLIDAFWPGPLTLILPRAPHIPAAVAGGQDSIGVRCPAHPVAQALLQEFKRGRGGIAAPSANKFGRISPTTAQHVRDEFGSGAIAAILDGGPSEVGIESSILDLTRIGTHGPLLLRPGRISVAQIGEVLGALPGLPDAQAPRASGTLDAHYAPHAPLVLVASATLPQCLEHLAQAQRRVALIHWSALDTTNAQRVLQLPPGPMPFAHAMYAAMRQLDERGTDVILVETPPQTIAWQAVNDRLRRAAFGSTGTLASLL